MCPCSTTFTSMTRLYQQHVTFLLPKFSSWWAISVMSSTPKNKSFVFRDLAKKIHCIHIVILPFNDVSFMPTFGLSLLASSLIRYAGQGWFLTTHPVDQCCSMSCTPWRHSLQVGPAVPPILHPFVKPAYVLILLSKVDIGNSYMPMWLRPEDLTLMAFAVPPHPLQN